MATRAAAAAGFICNGDTSAEMLKAVVEAITKTASIKSEALQFAVGEALCFVFGGRVSPRPLYLKIGESPVCNIQCAPVLCCS